MVWLGRLNRKNHLMIKCILISVIMLSSVIAIVIPLGDDNNVEASTIIDSGTCGINLTWTIDSEKILTINGFGSMYDYYLDPLTGTGGPWWYSDIEKVVINNGVTSIGVGAFVGCSSLASISIPSSVTSIGGTAFSGCSSLTSITIPSSVTSVDESAFPGCSSMISFNVDSGNPNYLSDGGIFFDKEKTKLIQYPAKKTGTTYTVPNTVTTLGNHAFENCSLLTSIEMSNSINSIGTDSFEGCTSLTTVSIPNSVTSIQHRTFNKCTSLTTVSIPNSVTSISSSAFEGCSSLENFIVDSGNTAYSSHEGVLYNKAMTTLIQYPAKKTATSYVFPNTVTTIDGYAFYGNTTLTSIVLPESMTVLNSGVFKECTSLSSVTLPPSLTTISSDAFYRCSALKSITLPETVTSIGLGAFACSGLTSIVIPNSVAAISHSTFYSCFSLKTVTLPSSLTTIDHLAFLQCTSLESIDIPDSVTTIGNDAFSNCRSLKTITIPSTVTTIGTEVFTGCSSLESFVVDPESPILTVENGVLFNKSKTTLMQYPAKKTDTSYVIPDSVTSIDREAFSGCESLSSITIPNTITVIKENTFSGCSSLTSITIPNSVTTIEPYAFDCRSLESITIPDSVTTLGNGAFRCNNLKQVTMPGYFANCGSTPISNILSSNDLTVTFTKSLDSVKTILGDYKLNPKTIIIDPSVTSIPDNAFSDCSRLENITMPGSYTSLGNGIFDNCRSLKTITFTGSLGPVKNIIGNSSVKEIFIDSSVTKIGEKTFEEINSLTVNFNKTASVTTIETLAFIDCKDLKIRIDENAKLYFNNGSIYYSDSNEHTVRVVAPEGYSIPSTALSGNVKIVYMKDDNDTGVPSNNNNGVLFVLVGAAAVAAIITVGIIFIKRKT